MAYEKKEGSGIIFKNDKKGNDKAPEYSGTAMLDGKDVKIALWVKEGAKGKFFSVKIENVSQGTSSKNNAAKQSEIADDLPF